MTDPYAQPAPPQQPTDITQGLKVAGIAMTAAVALQLVKWVLVSAFGTTGWILLLLMVAGGVAYLVYRQRNPQQAHGLEAQLQNATRNAVRQVTTPRPAAPVAPFTRAAYGYPMPVSPTVTGRPVATNSALPSILMLVPSLLAYGVVYSATSFSSAWQPWWILNGLNAFFLICAAGRALTPARRAPAVLVALFGIVLYGLATSPSPDVNLIKLFSTKKYYEGYSQAVTVPPTDLMPLLVSAGTISVFLFVLAWGIARRQGAWAIGLIPAGLVIWWSVWYQQHEGIGQPAWCGFWLANIGVFIGGCLACWAVDAMSKPRSVVPPQQYPTYP
ncbi:Uncharacterised protein [Mycobacteroides abscessus subsp. abscessus]|nr:Uncharacterised protein [Mycobacteroides abscessus subsp. abscessus]